MRRWLFLPLVLLLLAAAAPARAAFGECSAPGYVAAFDRTGLPNNACYEIARVPVRWSGGTATMRLLGVVGEPAFVHADIIRTAFEDLAGRVGAAMTAMGDVRVNDVSILLTHIPEPDHDSDSPTAAWTRTFTKHGECFVTRYADSGSASREFFMFVLSHEFFHCVTDATVYAAGESERSADTTWWLEGTAEYFANLAYPGTDYSDEYVSAFDQRSVSAPLWDFDYPSVVFFFWLAQEEGPRAISRFVRNIASGSGSAHADLARVISADAWKRFGEDYLDREIRAPGARAVPSHPRPGMTVRITAATEREVRGQPFVLRRERWVFVRGKVYELRQASIDPGLSVGFSREARKWSSPPDRVLACDQEQIYRVLATTTTDAGAAAYAVTVPRHLRSASACCMTGKWEPTDAAREGELSVLQEVGGGAIEGVGGKLVCAKPDGGWMLRFDPDGKGEVEWDGFGMQCTSSMMGGEVVYTWVRNGRKTFEWTSETEGAAQIRHLDNTLAMRMTMQMGPITAMDESYPDPGPKVSTYGVAVQCLRDDLRVEGLDGLGHRSETYKRVAPTVPAP